MKNPIEHQIEGDKDANHYHLECLIDSIENNQVDKIILDYTALDDAQIKCLFKALKTNSSVEKS